ncbi:MAG TPA: alpha/beta fold hydrolase [Streptosporangiaceae bacterium]|jgi:pimeloyl-ACP methyl ester carboxylesterase
MPPDCQPSEFAEKLVRVSADLIALLDALGIARADVLGFSYGGMIAARLALAAPGRVRRLIVASASLLPVPPDALGCR